MNLRALIEAVVEAIVARVGFEFVAWFAATAIFFMAIWLGVEFISWEWDNWPLEETWSRVVLLVCALVAFHGLNSTKDDRK